jgi:hypothetical protein
MKVKRIIMICLVLMTLTGLWYNKVYGELPEDFPEFIITQYGETAPGVLIGWLGWWAVDYYVVLDQSGYPLFYSKTEDMSYPGVMPNGLISAPAVRGFSLKDESFTIVDSFQMRGDYHVDIHDFKVLPNGHALILGTYQRYVDMSRVVDGGRPDAQVTDDVIQEIDADKNVIFEWHALDHIPITESFHDLTRASIDYAHCNSMDIDPIDNNLLVSLRTTSEIVKVDRSTGEVIWHLGGKNNDFTFVGEHEENAPYYFVGQHDVSRFPNGNIPFFDNGNISGGGVTESDRTYTRAVMYNLNEADMTATLVWEFRHDPDIMSPSGGRVQLFANGNILIDWGSAILHGTPEVPLVTEVSADGELVYELYYATSTHGARLQKHVWNSPDLVKSQTFLGIEQGGTYDSNETGVSVTLNNLEGSAYNGLVVKKHSDAVRFPRFLGKNPQVLVERVTLSGFGIDDITADVSFDEQNFDFGDPARLTVYHRPYIGHGVFTLLPTSYDSVNHKLMVTDAQFGEFIFANPDAPEVPLQPILYEPEALEMVNQEQPVTLEWTSSGFARTFDLQVATDAVFTDLVLDESGLKQTRYILDVVEPDTTYYWRVNTINYGGASQWAGRSFTTVAPMIQLTVPNGSEIWQRTTEYFIRWDDNLAEDVVIELYKADAFVETIDTVPSIGAYEWWVNSDLEPGDDYSIKVKSANDETLADSSDATFTIQ